MKSKDEIFNDITDFLNNVEDIECYMFMIRGLIDENIKLEKETEIAQMKEFVNSFYLLVKDIEEFNNTPQVHLEMIHFLKRNLRDISI